MIMEKWIILKTMDKCVFEDEISFVDDIAECDKHGNLLTFNSLEDASEYQERNAIDGQCVELPIY